MRSQNCTLFKKPRCTAVPVQAPDGAWPKAMKLAKGEKVLDDPKLLKRSLKRVQRDKKKSQEAWQERADAVQKKQAARQEKYVQIASWIYLQVALLCGQRLAKLMSLDNLDIMQASVESATEVRTEEGQKAGETREALPGRWIRRQNSSFESVDRSRGEKGRNRKERPGDGICTVLSCKGCRRGGANWKNVCVQNV
jgi:hypothetical protein